MKVEVAFSDKTNYTVSANACAGDRAALATDALIAHFWDAQEGYFHYLPDGLSREFQYWPQAHAMDCVVDAYLRTGDKRYSDLFKPWLLGIKKMNDRQEHKREGSRGGYWNTYNDDMEWIALTMLRIYNTNKDKRFLAAAQQMWKWIAAQWNTDYATRLYAITGKPADLELAKRAFDWQLSHLIDAEGGVMDNIDGRNGFFGHNWTAAPRSAAHVQLTQQSSAAMALEMAALD